MKLDTRVKANSVTEFYSALEMAAADLTEAGGDFLLLVCSPPVEAYLLQRPEWQDMTWLPKVRRLVDPYLRRTPTEFAYLVADIPHTGPVGPMRIPMRVCIEHNLSDIFLSA